MPKLARKVPLVMERDEVLKVCFAASEEGILSAPDLFFSHEALRRELQAAHFAIESFVQARNNNEVASARIVGKDVLEGGGACYL